MHVARCTGRGLLHRDPQSGRTSTRGPCVTWRSCLPLRVIVQMCGMRAGVACTNARRLPPGDQVGSKEKLSLGSLRLAQTQAARCSSTRADEPGWELHLALGGSAGSHVAVESAPASTVREPDSCCSSR